MSESTTTTESETESEQEQPQEGETKTFDEAYVKKLRDEAAKHRTEAKANAKAAERLAEIEAANKTEAERSADALAAAQREAAEAKADALRFRIASKHQISDEDAELFLTGTDEDTLTRQAERLTAREADRKKNGNHVPREGTNPHAKDDEDRAAARAIFGNPT